MEDFSGIYSNQISGTSVDKSKIEIIQKLNLQDILQPKSQVEMLNIPNGLIYTNNHMMNATNGMLKRSTL